MNSKHFIYTYLFTLIGGVLLIILHRKADLFDAISIILGIGFLVVGVLSLVSSVFISAQAKAAGIKRSPAVIIVSVASLVLGLLMVIVPGFFINYLVYTMGILLLLCGIIQLYNFIPGMKSISFSGIFLIVPSLAILAGVLIFVLGAEKVMGVLALVTGIVLTVYSVNGFAGYLSRRSLARQAGHSHRSAVHDEKPVKVIDVKAEEIKK